MRYQRLISASFHLQESLSPTRIGKMMDLSSWRTTPSVSLSTLAATGEPVTKTKRTSACVRKWCRSAPGASSIRPALWWTNRNVASADDELETLRSFSVHIAAVFMFLFVYTLLCFCLSPPVVLGFVSLHELIQFQLSVKQSRGTHSRHQWSRRCDRVFPPLSLWDLFFLYLIAVRYHLLPVFSPLSLSFSLLITSSHSFSYSLALSFHHILNPSTSLSPFTTS